MRAQKYAFYNKERFLIVKKGFMNGYFCIFDSMERSNKDISKRVVSFRNSDSPLTSQRARVIISNRKDSVTLAKAVRSLRHNEEASFKVSNSTETKIQDLQKA